MSPFSLIRVGRMHDRAGIACNSHFVLFPARLFALLKKVLGVHRRPSTIDS
ncbi:hypothetical protein VSR34_28555 [Paraburkholderia sp. JHI2823]|uniref:hypothetical protein n=1 Tax=Paraburkholderia TaxID=1822464 RepID=UPI0012B60FDA|nr:hypothetical protein [Paraburkholderia mimosarum]